VVDVGGGTGFCTQGVVQSIPPQNVTLIDQSPHQLAKARRKADLQGVTILEVHTVVSEPGTLQAAVVVHGRGHVQAEGFQHVLTHASAAQGDAEDLPFPTDSFDRYVSAGSIGALSVPRHMRAAAWLSPLP